MSSSVLRTSRALARGMLIQRSVRVARLPPQAVARPLSTYGGYIDDWPRGSTNTVLNIVPQGEVFVVERLGKLQSLKQSGWFLAIPVIDRIAYRVDMRERAMEITPQSCITKDNVIVAVSGNCYVQFVDPERAAYGSTNPLYAVRQFAQSSMRAAIGEMDLDEILHARTELNNVICGHLREAAQAWGLDVKRYEITEITPDRHIVEVMEKQATAERLRREKVLNAEGEKKAATLESEGVKTRLVNESEGERIAAENQAEANKKQLVLSAEGDAAAIRLRANAQAEALNTIANALNSPHGQAAANLQVAQRYIEMYGEMGSQSNTMIFSDKPGDFNTLLAQAAAVLKSTNATPVQAQRPEYTFTADVDAEKQ